MRLLVLATLSVLFVARPLVAQSPADPRIPVLSANDAQEDFDALRRALEAAG